MLIASIIAKNVEKCKWRNTGRERNVNPLLALWGGCLVRQLKVSVVSAD